MLVLVIGAATMTRRPQPSPAPAPDTAPRGVLVTPSGVVAPILATDEAGWWVRTPCYRVGRADAGTVVESVDVVLDPGHGGGEDGAVSPDGLREADVNAAVAEQVARRLEAQGLTVLVTHPNAYTLLLHPRGEIATALAPRVMVSIHHNSVYERVIDEPGTIALHQKDSAVSRRLAELLDAEVGSAIAPLGDRWAAGDDLGPQSKASVDDPRWDWFGLLRFSSSVPSVIVEAAYVGNGPDGDPTSSPEGPLLATDAFRDAEADGIARAIEAFLAEPPATTGEPPAHPSGAPAQDPLAASCVDPVDVSLPV